MMAAIRGTNSAFPCPTCLAPLEEMHKMSKEHEARSASNMKRLWESLKGKTKAVKEAVLQRLGLRDIEVCNPIIRRLELESDNSV